ncbi:MAG TPA: SDR family oxidoreductase [Steroidobacteraceae bacterium]|nr:SDR family oxidoreductase [Steroidobacteraceae bacterium]
MSRPVFLVLGGSRGIGGAICVAAGAPGRHVLLTYSSQADRAQGVVEGVRAAGGDASAIRADVAAEGDIAAVFREVDRLGPLTAMVYNSGITGPHSPLAQAETATIDRVLDVNLRGALLCAREAVKRMSTRLGGKGGNIVFISSRAAFYGSPNEFVWYAASKGGMDSLTSGLAREVGNEGIRVNAVSPGPIATEMHRPGKLESMEKRAPLQRAGTPAEVASTVLFLISDSASYVTGANLIVAGGM